MPVQFWELTLAEFNDLLEGYKFRNKLEWERTAQLGVWSMQPHVKEKLTVDKLINLKVDEKKKNIPSKEKQKETLNALFENF